MYEGLHVKQEEKPVMHVFSRLWYWIAGGIALAGERALDFKHAESTEFHLSMALMCLGLWLLIPPIMMFAGAFALVIQALLPVWIIGLMLIGIGRWGIHCMVKQNHITRCWAANIVMACWVTLALISLLARPLGIVTVLFLYLAWESIVLVWQLEKI